MKRFFVFVGVMFFVAISSQSFSDNCERCLDIVRNNNQFSPQLVQELFGCVQGQEGECKANVSKMVFEKFRVIIDFFGR